MKRNTPIINSRGFSLLELTVVVIILSILLSAVIPVLSRSYLEKAANKTALDMSAIQEASRKFYVDHNQWPDASVYATPIAALQAGGYLPSAWSATNPFVNYEPDLSDFNYYISTNATSLTVYTNVPVDAQPIIESLLPTPSVDPVGTGHHVYSSVSVPGPSSSLPVGTILGWPGFNATPQNAPPGFLWCNGQAVSRTAYSNLFAVLGTEYGSGDGIKTFNLPDMMGRVIVGVDAMGGAEAVNRIIDPRWTSQYTQFGGIFGESAHRQSILELAPHTHPFTSWDYVKGFSGNSTTSPRDPIGGTTGSTGGNADGSGLGAPANVVQPSMAMGYIIKY